MPSIRKQKIQKRSRQQVRRRVVTGKIQSNDRLQLDEERQKIDEEKQRLKEEMQRLDDERQRLEEEAANDNVDYKRFDNGGGCGGKKRANKRSKQQRRPLLNTAALTETDEQINKKELPTLDREDSTVGMSQQGGCGMKKNMRPYPRSAAEKEEMRQIINQGLASGELKLGPTGPDGNQTVVNAQTGGSKSTQHRSVSLRTAVKLLKNYYTKRN
jgi:hypothetical protein